MTDLIKYPEWQLPYLAAVMEADKGLLPEKLFRAEAAILERQEELTNGDGTNNAAELKALADAIRSLRLMKRTIFDLPDWK